MQISVLMFLTFLKCLRKRSRSLPPVSPMYNILHSLQVMQHITLVEVRSNRSVILIEYFGPEMLTVFWMEGRVLNRARECFKRTWLFFGFQRASN